MASKRATGRAHGQAVPAASKVTASPEAASGEAVVHAHLHDLHDALQAVCAAGRELWKCFERLRDSHAKACEWLWVNGHLRKTPSGAEPNGSSTVASEFLNDPSRAGTVEVELEIRFPAGFDLRESVNDYRRCRKTWHEAINEALEALGVKSVVWLMDGEATVAADARWTTELRRELASLRQRMPENPCVTNVGVADDGLALHSGLRALDRHLGRLRDVSPGVVAQARDGPGARRPDQVVLWEGAEHTPRNIKLARTRTAYLENGGNVKAALEALRASGHPIGQSTLYNHVNELDKCIPGWRDRHLLSKDVGNLGVGVTVRKHRSTGG
jgi:hypothetical protein